MAPTIPESHDHLLLRVGTNSLIQNGMKERPARKSEQKDIEFPFQILADAANPRFNTAAVIRAAYCAGWTVPTISRATGFSENKVTYCVKGIIEADPLFEYPKPVIAVPNMVKRSDLIPAERLEKLRELQKAVSGINGGTAVEDARRSLVSEYGDLLVKTLEEYSVGCQSLSKAMGLSGRNIQLWLGRHGYLHLPQSQQSYRNTTTAASRREKS